MAKAQFWGGRFEKDISKLMWDFSRGSCIDKYLFPYELKATAVHIKALKKLGILNSEEEETLLSTLNEIKESFIELPNYEHEDIHSFLQEELKSRVGVLAEKVHSFRSRNDLVAVDSILLLKDWAGYFVKAVANVQISLVKLADKNRKVIIPSYTHLQQAQVVYFSHYLLSYVEAFERVKQLFSTFVEAQKCPLSACAGAGTSAKLDVEMMATELGLNGIYANSIDAISNRDYYLDILYAMSRIAVITSRLCEDWIIYSSSEFGFLVLPEEFTTGSSIMPHKRNPDALELIRSRSSQIISALFSFFMMLKALPLSYNRDLQEDKEITIPILYKTAGILELLSELIKGVKINSKRLSSLINNDFLFATDFMEMLIRKGLSSRSAHHCVGRLVKESERQGKPLRELDIECVNSIVGIKVTADEYSRIFDPVHSVEGKVSYNGTCSSNVDRQIKTWEKILELRNA